MNKLTIIGNLTKDPELRTTSSKKNVCSFDVAVNRRKSRDEQEETDYFRVVAWQSLGELCARYLKKGAKVYVVGRVELVQREHEGKHYANMQLTAEDVEFLSTKKKEDGAPRYDKKSGMQEVQPDDLPY